MTKTFFYFVMFSCLFSFTVSVNPQEISCSDGILWQVEVGNSARVIEARPVRIYDMPSGNPVGRLTAGSQFTIISGPVCDDSGSTWWQLSTGDESQAWVLESLSGDYQIEPLLIADSQISNEPETCANQFPAQLTVGSLAQNIESNFLIEMNGTLIPASIDSLSEESVAGDLLVVQGPICINGVRYWQVRPEPSASDGTELWMGEANESGYIALPSNNTPQVIQYMLPETILYASDLQDSAPIIDVQVQLSYGGFGGGGDNGSLRSCRLENWNTTAPGCILQTFPAETTVVDVVIYRPDGVIQSTYSVDFSSQAPTNKFLRIDVPTTDNLKTIGGVWRIIFNYDEQTTTRAYYVPFPDLNGVFLICDKGVPIAQFYGFEETDELELELNSREQTSTFVRYDTIGTWRVPVADDGSAQARLNFQLDNYFDSFFVLEGYFNWDNVSGNSYPYFYPCPAWTTLDDAYANLIDYDQVIMGSDNSESAIYYAFEGMIGDRVNITGNWLTENRVYNLTLIAPNGQVVLSEEQLQSEGENPSFTETFMLADTGVYAIEINDPSNSDEAMEFIFTVENDRND